MKWEEVLTDRALWKPSMKKILFLITFTAALVYLLFNLEKVRDAVIWCFGLIGPFLVGVAVAFVLNVFVKLFEEKIFGALTRRGGAVWIKIKRPVSVLLSFVAVFVLLSLIIFYIIPEFASSLKMLTDNLPVYVQQFSQWAMEQLNRLEITQDMVNSLKIDWSKLISQVTTVTTDFVSSIFTVAMSVASGVVSFIMSLIFSIYMLFGKEKLIRNCKRAVYAFLPKAKARRVVRVGSLSNKVFSGFVTGQLTEAVIIGLLCYGGMTLLQFPYALLISVIVSITSVVPILGAYLGGGLGAFILLIVNPPSCLWFMIFLVVLQQVEGNLIYPRVVGGSIGLPGIWVLLAILICGDVAGIPGILLGVPLFSVLYTLFKEAVLVRLRRRQVTDTEIDAPVDLTLGAELEAPTEEEPTVLENQEQTDNI